MQSSRELILEAIRKNKGEQNPLIQQDWKTDSQIDLVETYRLSLQKNGGVFISDERVDISSYIKEKFPDAQNICSLVERINGNVDIQSIQDPHVLNNVDVAIIHAQVGVAENAANWVTDKEVDHRALPFIAQHLIIVLKKNDLVSTMHQAYQKINMKDIGFGVFIAGPSKTADIEQSLVVGAHGPRSLTVFVV
jgi:L-lactate dehydrogenase complex protein LldG